jgi:hypothetical protein
MRSFIFSAMASAFLLLFAGADAWAQQEGGEQQPGKYKQEGQQRAQEGMEEAERKGRKGMEKGQQQMPAGQREAYMYGAFNDDFTEDDWFYDSYSLEQVEGWTDINWYNQSEVYSGFYDDTFDDTDWFYDSYDDPGQTGLFDV